MPQTVRSALYLDFDNVFGGLLKVDPKRALHFAENPGAWLSRLTSEQLTGGIRRFLVLRCYMNPSGVVSHPLVDGSALKFSRFRAAFTKAGFEVVDCPRLSHTKNGADIRLVLDAVEDLRADVRYDEFVIASGDTDMTPLLVRLRAGDRLVTVFSPSEPAVVLGAIAHRLIGGEDLLELLQPDPTDLTEGLAQSGTEQARLDGATGTDPARSSDRPLDPQEAWSVFESFIGERYSTASEALNLPALAHQVSHKIGSAGKATRWFGHGGFRKALQALDLPGARMSDQHLWDGRRHGVPHADEPEGPETPPEAVARVASELKLQVMSREAWPLIFTSLAKFVAAYEFNLAEATKWARDQVAKQGVEVNRKVVSAVAFGTAYGGCPLYRSPPPLAAEIGEAFVTNVLARAAAADVELSEQDMEDVRSWFGADGEKLIVEASAG